MTANSYESRAVRIAVLQDALFKAGDAGVTTAQAARLLGLKRSTHVRNMLKELVGMGLAVVIVTPYRKNVDKQVFMHWTTQPIPYRIEEERMVF